MGRYDDESQQVAGRTNDGDTASPEMLMDLIAQDSGNSVADKRREEN